MASTEWETPQDFFDKLDAEFHFTVDAAASIENYKCLPFLSRQQNSLNLNWNGTVWLNPPYTKDIDQWVKKAYESAQNGATVVCLLQGRSSDTKWWHNYVMKSSEIRYIKDRLHFGLDKKFNRANISSIVVVFKPYCAGLPTVSSIDTKGNQL